MAGAGVKLFLSGEIAYAADINQYLMDQSVSLFLNEAARNSAFGNGIPITQAGGDGKPLLTAGRICFLLEAAGSTVGSPIRTIQYYDGATWVDSGQFTTPDGAITSAKLNTSVAGSGLSGGAGTALAVNVDDSTIEINSDTLRLKDAGITSAKILNETIMNVDINPSAAIAHSKLQSTTAGNILLGATTTGVVTATTLSGDVTVNGAGVTAIGGTKVTNAMLAGSIDKTKITGTAVTTADNGTVTTGMILDGTVLSTDLNYSTPVASGGNREIFMVTSYNAALGKIGDIQIVI